MDLDSLSTPRQTCSSVSSCREARQCCAAQFGHLFAKGDTREAAIRAMVVALKEVKIRGEIRTTIDYCVEMIQSPDFVGNAIHTGWLDSRIASHVSPDPLLSKHSGGVTDWLWRNA